MALTFKVLFIYNSKVAPVLMRDVSDQPPCKHKLGTVQRYLSTCCTKEGPILDHFFITLTTFLPVSHRLLFSLAIHPMEPQDAHNSSVGHTFTPHSIYSWG